MAIPKKLPTVIKKAVCTRGMLAHEQQSAYGVVARMSDGATLRQKLELMMMRLAW